MIRPEWISYQNLTVRGDEREAVLCQELRERSSSNSNTKRQANILGRCPLGNMMKLNRHATNCGERHGETEDSTYETGRWRAGDSTSNVDTRRRAPLAPHPRALRCLRSTRRGVI
ncbi:hypothetical protein EVAR_80009_1 [Eumeta japonica]|uniref:Uncharacterized protein n=1 Tax=Eumeta variegata TaxID=151549 RepID=A0A4C1WP68_EUMVA|nr:hypothetical protein EVAR_80009_1 [Eumeta japonica]